MRKQDVLATIDLMRANLQTLRDRVDAGELEQTGEITIAIMEDGEKLEAEFLG